MAIRSKSAPQLVTDLRPAAKKTPPLKRFSKYINKNLKLIVILLLVLGVGLLAYGYLHTRNELNRLSNSETASKDAAKDLVSKVGKLVDLPTDETPTTATVQDATKLNKQEFFARAQNGDKVLVYSKSSRAVLYRPSTNKVIEFSKVNFNTQQ